MLDLFFRKTSKFLEDSEAFIYGFWVFNILIPKKNSQVVLVLNIVFMFHDRYFCSLWNLQEKTMANNSICRLI